ncbi:hypothetical protein [Chitinophaga sp. Cy-1792]|nr:hypothetical protein [Chitinophaga sp. Cy-1792]
MMKAGIRDKPEMAAAPWYNTAAQAVGGATGQWIKPIFIVHKNDNTADLQ